MTIREETTKNGTTLWIRESYRKEDGTVTSRNIERLGTLEEIMAMDDCDGDPHEWARRRLEEYRMAAKEGRRLVKLALDPNKLIARNEQRSFNGGYLFLQQQYCLFGLDRIFKAINRKRAFNYDLDAVMRMLVFARVIGPSSKSASVELSKTFIEQPDLELHQVYRALGVLEEEGAYIQRRLFKNTCKVRGRDTSLLYYDGTNVFYECMGGDGFRETGPSKENRPNPITQIGMFTDRDGMPLAIKVCSGDTAEQTMMIPLEDEMEGWFEEDAHVIYCTDAAMASYACRDHNRMAERDFICVQPIRKLEHHLQAWCLETKGWRRKFPPEAEAELSRTEEGRREIAREYDIEELAREDEGKENGQKKYRNWTLYRERPIKTMAEYDKEEETVAQDGTRTRTTVKKKVELTQRLIATFSFKFRDFLRAKRELQLDKAGKLLDKGKSAVERKSGANPRKYIKGVNYTDDGEVATNTSYAIDEEYVQQQEKYDGFYAVCTSVEGETATASEVLASNSGRWVIEDCFRILKHDLQIRPVYVSRKEHIIGHVLSCFIAVVLLLYLLRRVNTGRNEDNRFSVHQLVDTLRDMNFLYVNGEGYIPEYTRTDITDRLHGSAGFRTDTEVVTKKKMREIIAITNKNSELLSRGKSGETS